jgi:pyrimidine deaminase RibD-like protein
MDKKDANYMQLAITLAHKSEPIQSAYCVGAVLVASDAMDHSESDFEANILSTGFSRELNGNTHAEECCLIKLETFNKPLPINCTMYTTMEPCGERLSGKKPCAMRIIESGIISRVVVGITEPANFISECAGTQILLKSGVQVDYLKGFEGKKDQKMYKLSL